MGTDYSFPLFYTCPMVNGEDRASFGQLQPTTCFMQTPFPVWTSEAKQNRIGPESILLRGGDSFTSSVS